MHPFSAERGKFFVRKFLRQDSGFSSLLQTDMQAFTLTLTPRVPSELAVYTCHRTISALLFLHCDNGVILSSISVYPNPASFQHSSSNATSSWKPSLVYESKCSSVSHYSFSNGTHPFLHVGGINFLPPSNAPQKCVVYALTLV